MPENSFPACFGPYLRLDLQSDTQQGYFERTLRLDVKRMALIVELSADMTRTRLVSALEAYPLLEAVLGPAPDESRFVSLYVDRAGFLGTLKSAAPDWDALARGIELCLPLAPLAGAGRVVRSIARPRSTGLLLLAMLDDGCPFAHARLRVPAGIRSRVLAVWDQNQRQPVVDPVSGDEFGVHTTGLGYGLEFWRDTVPPAPGQPRLVGLDDWIAGHVTPGGVDEPACYRAGGFRGLARSISHGSHILDTMAGNLPPSSRIGPVVERRDPPSWAAANDAASGADLVFVQIPQAAVDDATGNWLGTYVADAIEYTMSCAQLAAGSRVIMNISYGPATGPHDGSAYVERMLADKVRFYDGSRPSRPKLEIVLASGNSYLSRGHVAVQAAAAGSRTAWRWRIPPDNPALCISEVWTSSADAPRVQVELTSPLGVTTAAQPTPMGASTVWVMQVPATKAVPPEPLAPPVTPAPAGDWTVGVRIDRAPGAPISFAAYAARTEPNMGSRTGARGSWFVDPDWERRDAAFAAHDRRNGEFQLGNSLVVRDGTLNGMATGNDPAIHVAGACVIIDGRKSPYASAGPARGGAARQGPDFALPCDESFLLVGIRAGGALSGNTFRMVGTSSAAPQLARWLANGFDPAAPNPPPTNPGGVLEPTRRGAGNLPAP